MFKSFQLSKQLMNRACLTSSIRFYSPQSKTTKGVMHVNLVDENNKFMFSGTIDEVKRYAKKHDLHLVNDDSKSHESTKKLQMKAITKRKLVETEDDKSNDPIEQQKQQKKKSKKQKDLKRVIFNETTSDHDLDVKANRMAFFLYKNFKIRLVINGTKSQTKMAILDKLKKKFVPHLSFKQVNIGPTAIKLLIVPENTWHAFYEENFKKINENMKDDEHNDDDDEDLIEMDLEDLVNQKLEK